MGSRLEVPKGVRNWGTGQAGRDTIQEALPAATPETSQTVRGWTAASLSVYSILGFLGRGWQLMEGATDPQGTYSTTIYDGCGRLGGTGDAGGGDQCINHKGSQGAPSLGPCSGSHLRAGRAHVRSLCAQVSGQNPITWPFQSTRPQSLANRDAPV